MHIPILPNYWRGVRELVADIQDYREHLRAAKPDREPPLYLTDEVLGTFTYNRRAGSFEQELEWSGAAVTLTLDGTWPATAPDRAAAAQLAVSARQFWREEARWLDQLKGCATKDLLELANEWSADKGPVSAEQFHQQIIATSISIEAGGFEVWFSGNDLFGEHEILVYGTWENGPEYAEFHG